MTDHSPKVQCLKKYMSPNNVREIAIGQLFIFLLLQNMTTTAALAYSINTVLKCRALILYFYSVFLRVSF